MYDIKGLPRPSQEAAGLEVEAVQPDSEANSQHPDMSFSGMVDNPLWRDHAAGT